MHPDLTPLSSQLESLRDEVTQLADAVDDTTWVTRPSPTSWSIGECVEHLLLTNEAFLPAMHEQLQRPEARARAAPARMRRGVIAWVLCRALEPPVRSRYPTTAPFVPASAPPRTVTARNFVTSQEALLATIRLGDGVDLTRIRLVSPFDARLEYSFFSALHIIAAHQRRHLWQARRAREQLISAR
jgi:hypothetical protein